MTDKNKIIKFHKKRDINIGIVIFIAIFIYLVINIYIFFTKSDIPIYEVQPGQIYSPETYSGIILRDEVLYNTDVAGYINYYFREGSRVSKSDTVYSIDSDRSIYDYLTGDKSEIKLSAADVSEMKQTLSQQFKAVGSYREISDIKANILSSYQILLDKTLLDQLNEIVLSTGITSNFHVVNSISSGIISYMYDEYTMLTKENITADLFQKAYNSSSLYTIDLVAAEAPVYKMIKSDKWSIILMVDEAFTHKLADKKTIDICINDNHTISSVPISFYQIGNDYFAELNLNKYITNYTLDRFVHVTFLTDVVEGLKIPETAITLKDYYRIPDSYFVQMGNDSASTIGLITEGFNTETGEKAYTSVKADIFYSNDGFSYIDATQMNGQTYIVTQDLSVRTMLYTFITKMEGAYNINKGYAVFRRIERLNSKDDYCIIKKNSMAGLSAYDHIALNASEVTEGAVIY